MRLSAEAENLRHVLRVGMQRSIAEGLSKEEALNRAHVIVGSVGNLCREQRREGHLLAMEEIGRLLAEDLRAMPDPPLVVRLPKGTSHPSTLPPARLDAAEAPVKFIWKPPARNR